MMKQTTKLAMLVLAALIITAAMASAENQPCWREIYRFPEQAPEVLPQEYRDALRPYVAQYNGRKVSFVVEQDDCGSGTLRVRERRSKKGAVLGVFGRIGLGALGTGFAITGNVPGVIGVGAAFQSMSEGQSYSARRAAHEQYQAQEVQQVPVSRLLDSGSAAGMTGREDNRSDDRLLTQNYGSSNRMRRPLITATVRTSSN